MIHPKGGKYWRLDYRFEGRRKTLAIGTHPETSLKEARKKRDRARSDIEDGIDPSGHQNGKPAIGDDSFETVAREWHEKYRSQWTEGHASTTLRRLEANLLPWLGKRPLGAIEPPELLRSLRRVENRGAVETAHRIQQIASRIFRYDVATGRCSRDPTLDLKGALPPKRSEHFPTITDPKKIGALLRAVDDYQGSFITRIALQLAPLVFVRPVSCDTQSGRRFNSIVLSGVYRQLR